MPNLLSFQTNDEVLRELGSRLRAYRLQQNLPVADVAVQAGVNRNTVLNAEGGKNPRLETIIRLLRVYGRIDALDAFLPPPAVSPLQLVKTKGRPRRRARRPADG